MSLGLEDRSARLLSGRDVWSEIKALLAGHNDVQAAIAFVGADADQYLPLRGPATIVVNAGEEALRNGWTDPSVLLRWTRRGVRVHTLSTLHAKVLFAQGNPPFVLVGSADVLSTSGRAMEEAILVADEKDTVDEVRRAVDRWRRLSGDPLTDAWLQAAALRYRPPGALSATAPSSVVIDTAVAAPPAVAAPVAVAPATTPALPVTAPPSPVGAPTPASAPEPTDTSVADVGANEPATFGTGPVDGAVLLDDALLVDRAVLEDTATPDGAAAGGALSQEPTSADSADQGAVEPQSAAPADGAALGTSAVNDVAAGETAAMPGALAAADGADTSESPAAPAGPVLPPVWPRPKFIYLATLTRDGRASESAHEQLEALRSDYRVASDNGSDPVLDVEMFWWDAATRSAAKNTSYREGWHIVPISVPASGRPAVLSPVHSPGRVLHSFTEYSGGPARTYYYLLIHQQGTPTTFRKLREALTAVGEKPSYDHAYMMQHKVAAILDLWPTIHYTA